MSKYSLANATKQDLQEWDDFVDTSINGTIFSQTSFLLYHRRRFEGHERFVVVKKGNTTVGQLNMATSPTEPGIARSPYGGSFGGLVLRRSPSLSEARSIVGALREYFLQHDLKRFVAVSCPYPLTYKPVDTLALAFIEAGAIVKPQEVTSVIDLTFEGEAMDFVEGRVRTNARKAHSMGVRLIADAPLADFIQPHLATYRRHGRAPTHTPSDLHLLKRTFPEAITFPVAYVNGEPVASACFFQLSRRTIMAYYLAQTEQGMGLGGLSLLLVQALELFRNQGFKWLDLGTSTADLQARDGVFRFKEGFGAFGLFRNTLEWGIGGHE